MTSWPTGVTLGSLDFTDAFTSTNLGDVVAVVEVSLVLIGTDKLVCTLDNSVYLPFTDRYVNPTSVPFPLVDQAVWNDGSGNAYNSFAAQITTSFQVDGGTPQISTVYAQPTSAQPSWVVAAIPQGDPGSPVVVQTLAPLDDAAPSTTAVYSSQRTQDAVDAGTALSQAASQAAILSATTAMTLAAGAVQQGNFTTAALGLGLVNNTADLDKPVSTLQAAAIAVAAAQATAGVPALVMAQLAASSTAVAAAQAAVAAAASQVGLVAKSDLGVGLTIPGAPYLAALGFRDPITGAEFDSLVVNPADGTIMMALDPTIQIPTGNVTGPMQAFDDPIFAVSFEFDGQMQQVGITHKGELLFGGQTLQQLIAGSLAPPVRTALYFYFGQSNGYYGSTPGPLDANLQDGVFEWPNPTFSTIYGAPLPAENPLHFFTQMPDRVSHALWLAAAHRQAHQSENVLIVPTNMAGVGYSTSPNSIGVGGNVRVAAFQAFQDAVANTPNSYVAGFVYSQGEAEAAPLSGQIAPGAFEQLLDPLLAQVRASYPDVPIVITQMVPTWVDQPASNSPSRHTVDVALIRTPSRWENCVFVPGPATVVDDTGTVVPSNNDGESIHYNAYAHQVLGALIYDALQVAPYNTSDTASTPTTPNGLQAVPDTSDGTLLHVTWTAPASAYGSFTVTWTDGTGTERTDGVTQLRDPMFFAADVQTDGTCTLVSVATVSTDGHYQSAANTTTPNGAS